MESRGLGFEQTGEQCQSVYTPYVANELSAQIHIIAHTKKNIPLDPSNYGMVEQLVIPTESSK